MFSKPYEIELPAIPSARVYFFNTDSGMRYEVRFNRQAENYLHVGIVFGVINDEFDGEEYVMTNKHEVYRVMATMVKIIEIFRKEHPNVNTFDFTGESKGDEKEGTPNQRILLYHRYVNRIFDEKEWDISREENKITIKQKKTHWTF